MTIHAVHPGNVSASNAEIRALTATELIARMASACREERRLTAEVVACLMEVDRRRLHLRAACSSLFDYCTRHLGMSGGAAHRRINAARLAEQFPCLLPKLARGELHLCGLLILRDHFTEANAEELSTAASGLSEAKLRELLAARAPRPPVPERVQPISGQSSLLSPEQPAPCPSRTTPLSPMTYALQLTMTAETHAKLRRAQDMMRHRQPDGNLAVVLDRALDALLAKLESEILAKSARPRAGKGPTKGVSRATRREVFERDGQQCTYRSEAGDRCPALAFLELDHTAAQGLGGGHASSNLRVRCQAHNHLHAEDDFGVEHVATRTEERRACARHAAGTPTPPSPQPPDVPTGPTQTSGHLAAVPAEPAQAAGPSAHLAAVATDPTQSAEPSARSPAVPTDPTQAAGPSGHSPADRERMAVYGLTDMGFARSDCVAVARAVLDRSPEDHPISEVFREAIGVLASLPRKTARGRPARPVAMWPWT